jgi:hypothetical protein
MLLGPVHMLHHPYFYAGSADSPDMVEKTLGPKQIEQLHPDLGRQCFGSNDGHKQFQEEIQNFLTRIYLHVWRLGSLLLHMTAISVGDHRHSEV